MPFHPGQGRVAGLGAVEALLLHPCPASTGQTFQPGGGPQGRLKDALGVVVRVTHQGHGDMGLVHELLQHLLLLGGEVGEAEHGDLFATGPPRFRQLLGQHVQAVAGVGGSLSRQGLIGGVE